MLAVPAAVRRPWEYNTIYRNSLINIHKIDMFRFQCSVIHILYIEVMEYVCSASCTTNVLCHIITCILYFHTYMKHKSIKLYRYFRIDYCDVHSYIDTHVSHISYALTGTLSELGQCFGFFFVEFFISLLWFRVIRIIRCLY